MTQPKTDLAYLRSEKSKAEQKLRSFQHREKFLERQMSELNRRERVHRLCTRAGMLESFLVCPGELTDDQVMELLKISFRQPEVVLALAKMVHDVHERSDVRIKGAIIHLVVTCCVSFASVQKHKCSFTPQFLLFPIKSSSMLFRGPLYVKLRSCRRLDEIEAGVCSPARFHPKENCIFLALLCSYPFACYHKTRIEKADWKQQHFQSAYLLGSLSERQPPALLVE